MKCSRCGGDCQIITETNSEGQDFSASKGCCGVILLGPIGILCGLCGEGRKINSTSFWICNQCGNKFRT